MGFLRRCIEEVFTPGQTKKGLELRIYCFIAELPGSDAGRDPASSLFIQNLSKIGVHVMPYVWGT